MDVAIKRGYDKWKKNVNAVLFGVVMSNVRRAIIEGKSTFVIKDSKNVAIHFLFIPELKAPFNLKFSFPLVLIAKLMHIFKSHIQQIAE